MDNPDFYEAWDGARDKERLEAFTKASPAHGVPFYEFVAGVDLSGHLSDQAIASFQAQMEEAVAKIANEED